MEHKDIIIDTDAKFEIDPITRVINNVSATKTTVIQHDHNSERFGFSLPRYIEGHDMMDCNRVEIHYKNTDNGSKEENAGVYKVADMEIDEADEERIVFSWLVSQNATQRVGTLEFLVRLSCIAEDGTVEYVWNSSIFKGIFVSTGMYNSEGIEQQYIDVLEQWKVELARNATLHKPFIVTGNMTVNKTTDSYEFDSMSATYKEIKNVYEQGKEVVLKLLLPGGETLYSHMTGVDVDGWLTFQRGAVATYSPYTRNNRELVLNIWCKPGNIWTAADITFAYLHEHQALEWKVTRIEPFIVTGNMTVNKTTDSYEFDSMSATYEEIKNVYEQGKEVVLKLLLPGGESSHLHMTGVDEDGWLTFQRGVFGTYSSYISNNRDLVLDIWCEPGNMWKAHDTTFAYLHEHKTLEWKVTQADEKIKAMEEDVTNVTAEVRGISVETDNKISVHNIDSESHNDIRLKIKEVADRLNAFLDTDDITLDQLSEIIAYINDNKELIDSITTSKVSVSDIIDNLTTPASDKPLSAKQGTELKALMDTLSLKINSSTPYIGENGNWYELDRGTEAFVDTGVKAEGYTPQKGTDYWTEEDKAEIKSYVDEAILGGAW